MENKKFLFHRSHISPLIRLVDDLNAKVNGVGMGMPVFIPHFDPCGGGLRSRLMFLMEKPGPGAVRSGFISQDNDDPTARNITAIFDQIKIDRSRVCIWNAVAGWNGTRSIKKQELEYARLILPEILVDFRELAAIVLVGRKAASVAGKLRDVLPDGIKYFESPHPSPIVRNRWPAKYKSIASVWGLAASHAGVGMPQCATPK